MPHTHFGQTRSPLGPIFLGTQTVVITNQRPSKGIQYLVTERNYKVKSWLSLLVTGRTSYYQDVHDIRGQVNTLQSSHTKRDSET